MDNAPPILFSNAKPNISFTFNSRRSKSNSLKIQYLNNRNYYINNTGYKISYKDESLYNYTKHRIFIIDNFKPNVPVKIYYDLTCLTEEKDNTISFELQNSGLLQDFIFLKHDTKEDTYYIKTASNKFLGSPNSNNIVYCYSSKNKFTEWRLYKLGLNKYSLIYAGEKYDPKKINIVGSRYNENIDWLIPYNDIAIVINKGNRILPNFSNIIHTNNIGREGHSYLYYIINRYETLPKRVIFTQGSPFDHNETLLYAIDNYDLLLPIQPLGLQYLKSKNIPPTEIVESVKITTDFGLEYLVLEANGDLLTSFKDYGANLFVSNYAKEYGKQYDSSLNLINNFFINSELIDEPQIDRVLFSYSALFSVTREIIMNRPLSFYVNLIDHLTDKSSQGGVNGYILEKIWLHIFSYDHSGNYYPFTGASNEINTEDLSINILSS
jgi:hypothetical protein